MKNISIKQYLIFFFSLPMSLLISSPVFANGVVVLYGKYTSDTFSLFTSTRGIIFILIIAIETAIIKFFLKSSLGKALLLTFIINLVSAIIGGIFFLGVAKQSDEIGIYPIIISLGPWILNIILLPYLFYYERDLSWVKSIGLAIAIILVIFFSFFFFIGSNEFLISILITTTSALVMLLRLYKAPIWFYVISIPLFFIGYLASGPVSLREPMSKNMLFWLVEAPLVAAFALTIIIEAITAKGILGISNIWKVITIGNIASYLVLALIFPFYAPNPYTRIEPDRSFRGYRHDFDLNLKDPEKTVEILRLGRTSTLHLIGWNRQDIPLENYDANFEINILENIRLDPHKVTYYFNTYQAIIKDTSSIQTLTPEAEYQLRWFENFFHFVEITSQKIDDNDQDGLNQVHLEWNSWQKENPYFHEYNSHLKWNEMNPEERQRSNPYYITFSPAMVVENMISKRKSNLVPPEEEKPK